MTEPPALKGAPGEYRRQVAAWIEAEEKRTGLTRVEVASRAGVSASTLYRYFEEGGKHVPSQSTLAKLAAIFGGPAPIPGRAEPPPEVFGLAMAEAPAEFRQFGNNQSWWTVRDRALELAGCLKGDRVLLDQSVSPRAGDVVVAQIYDYERGTAETVLRIFAPPCLLTRTADPALADRADVVDTRRGVVVMGPVVRLVRDRLA